MDLKKFSFPDQFLYCTSPRIKVGSGFGLGVVVSLIFLSVLLFNFSFKAPILNPMFQGFNTFDSNSKSVGISWPFSFSTTNASSSSSSSVNSTANITATKLKKPVDFMQTGKTREANVSDIGSNGNLTIYGGKGTDLEDTRLRNLSVNVKNESFTVEGNVIGERNRNGNESSVGESVGSREYMNSGTGKSEITSAHKISNLTNIGENGGSKEERGSEMNFSPDQINATISHYGSQTEEVYKNSLEKCDIFDGRWVRDDTKPYYPAGSCPHIDRDFDCYLNRRPDDGFVKWRWQPNDCDIPSLNATDFLERLRGKKLVFVGDSLNRNMWESLVCILQHSVKDKKRVYEISGKREFKKKGFYAFRFEDFNCTVDFISSPFLVRESSFNGKNGSLETLRLDLMDRTTSMYHDADILIFNTGHWWTHEKTSKGEDYYQEGNFVHPRLKVLKAYKRALGTWARWIDKNIDGKRAQVIFRGYSVTHFRGGRWNSGGQCHKETEPIFSETRLAKYPSKMRALEYVLPDMRTPVTYLNISRLTDYRKDAHPSIYRMDYKTQEEQIAAVHSQDCSHWCLPGVPDTWNELLYASLLKIGKGLWKT